MLYVHEILFLVFSAELVLGFLVDSLKTETAFGPPGTGWGLNPRQSLLSVLGHEGPGLGAVDVSMQLFTTAGDAGDKPRHLRLWVELLGTENQGPEGCGQREPVLGQYAHLPAPPHPTPVNTNPGSESLIFLIEKIPHVPSPCLYSAGRCTRGNKDLLWEHAELRLCGKRKQVPDGDWVLGLSYPWVSGVLVVPTSHIPADDSVSIVLKSVSESSILPRPVCSLPQAGKTTFSIPDPNPTSLRPVTLMILTQ